MPHTVIMLRQDSLYAVRVTASDGQLLMVTRWHRRPEEAVAEAKAWIEQTLSQAETVGAGCSSQV